MPAAIPALSLSNALTSAMEDLHEKEILRSWLQNQTELTIDRPISTQALILLFELLENNNSVRVLDLSYHSITLDTHSSLGLATLLNNNIFLQDLSLTVNNNNTLRDVSQALETNSTLKSLSIRGEAGSTLQSAIKALEKNAGLDSLRIHVYSLDDESTAALISLVQNHKTLRELDLNSTLIPLAQTKQLADALRNNKTIQSLNLCRSLRPLIDYRGTGNAHRMHLSYQRQDKEFFEFTNNDTINTIIKSVTQNSNLKSLSLNGNFLGLNQVITLAQELKTNKNLSSLFFNGALLGVKDGLTILAKALQENSTIEVLTLDFHHFSESDIQALCNVLKTNKTLTSLSLEHTNLNNKGAKALAKVLKKNTTLTQLSLNHTQISDKGAEFLIQALEKNLNLIKIKLGPALSFERPFFAFDRGDHLSQTTIEKLERVIKASEIAKQRIMNDALKPHLPHVLINMINEYFLPQTDCNELEVLVQRQIDKAKQIPQKPKGFWPTLYFYLSQALNRFKNFIYSTLGIKPAPAPETKLGNSAMPPAQIIYPTEVPPTTQLSPISPLNTTSSVEQTKASPKPI